MNADKNPITGKTIFGSIVNFFTEDGWSFVPIEKDLALHLTFQGNNGKWNCYAKAREADKQFVFYSIFPVNAPENKKPIVAEFIARVNYGMIIGNFELDFNDGEIRYKTSITVEDDELSFVGIKNLVYTNVTMMDKYLPGLISIINSVVSTETAINQIEQNQDITTSADDFEQLVDVVATNEQKELALNTPFQADLQQPETIPENKEHILTILTREEIGKFHEALQVLPRSRRRQAEEIMAKLKREINTRLGESGEEIFNQAHTFFSEVKIEIKNIKLIQRYSGLAHQNKLLLQNLNDTNSQNEEISKENRTAIIELENIFWSINTRLQELPTDNLEGMKEVELLREIEEFRYQLTQFERLIKDLQ